MGPWSERILSDAPVVEHLDENLLDVAEKSLPNFADCAAFLVGDGETAREKAAGRPCQNRKMARNFDPATATKKRIPSTENSIPFHVVRDRPVAEDVPARLTIYLLDLDSACLKKKEVWVRPYWWVWSLLLDAPRDL